MQTRKITVDYARPRGYDVGYRAENNFTLLALPIPAELEGADSYRAYFESTVGEYLQTELLTPADGYVTVKITSDIVPEPGNMAAQLVAFRAGEIVGYAPMITGTAKVSIPDGTERLSHSLAAEIALNTAARHSHENKAVLDKFAETDGKLQYNGSDVGLKGDKGDKGDPGKNGADGSTGAAGADGVTPHIGENGNWFIGSTDTGKPSRGGSTAEDISYMLSEDIQNDFPELAELKSNTVKSGLDVAIFCAFAGMFAKYIQCDVQTATGTVQFDLQNLFDNSIMPALKQAHEHDNKSVLDLISATDGKLQYNGSDVGLKGDKGDKGDPGSDANVTKANVITALGYTPKAVSAQVATGTEITLADNTEYRLADVTTSTLTYPTSDFECWMRLTFAASGTITVTLPADTKYIGTAPDFKNGETWELSFKDKVLAAQKVGEGA